MTRQALVAAALVAAVAAGCCRGVGAPAVSPVRILVMTRTAGYRHESIDAGSETIKGLGTRHGFAVETTEDAGAFSRAGLAQYAAVVFLNTTGDILNPQQQAALESFIRSGGGFVGIHSATDTEYEWPWYGRLVGARFAGHGPVEPAALEVVDGTHPSTRHLPQQWPRRDEWYRFRDVAGDLRIVVERRDSEGVVHPVAWFQHYDGGRSWYTAAGHTPASFTEPLFVEHLLGGILWTMGKRGSSDQALGSR